MREANEGVGLVRRRERLITNSVEYNLARVATNGIDKSMSELVKK
jgi:hypothetical protein